MKKNVSVSKPTQICGLFSFGETLNYFSGKKEKKKQSRNETGLVLKYKNTELRNLC
jgi:hypothetical protein